MCFPPINTLGTVVWPVHSAKADWILSPSPSYRCIPQNNVPRTVTSRAAQITCYGVIIQLDQVIVDDLKIELTHTRVISARKTFIICHHVWYCEWIHRECVVGFNYFYSTMKKTADSDCAGHWMRFQATMGFSSPHFVST